MVKQVMLLFETTGLAAAEFERAGFRTICVDIDKPQAADNRLSLGWDILAKEIDLVEMARECVLVFGMPPCTDLTSTGAAHFASKREREIRSSRRRPSTCSDQSRESGTEPMFPGRSRIRSVSCRRCGESGTTDSTPLSMVDISPKTTDIQCGPTTLHPGTHTPRRQHSGQETVSACRRDDPSLLNPDTLGSIDFSEGRDT